MPPAPREDPSEFTADTLEAHLHRSPSAGGPIYLAVLLLLAVGLALLPVVAVDVTVQGRGMIRPMAEKHSVVSSVSGFVTSVSVQRHQRVEVGDEILRIDGEAWATRKVALRTRLAELTDEVLDLEALTSWLSLAAPAEPPLRTERYRAELTSHVRGLEEMEHREQQLRLELGRTAALAARDLAPQADVTASHASLASLHAEMAAFRERQRSAWLARLSELRLEIADVRALLVEAEERSAGLIVQAPIAGTIEELAPLSAGSFVQPGDVLAVVSPSRELLADVLVAPDEIGLIHIGTPVTLLVDAYNYRDWGTLRGEVLRISDDYVLIQQAPMFSITVGLKGRDLRLPNGARGELRKGMTLTARFRVTRRTLWQLLRDDVDDWLNPLDTPAEAGGSHPW